MFEIDNLRTMVKGYFYYKKSWEIPIFLRTIDSVTKNSTHRIVFYASKPIQPLSFTAAIFAAFKRLAKKI